MRMNVAAIHGVKARPMPVARQSSHLTLVPSEPTIEHVGYRPSVKIDDPLWNELHKNTQDWLAAILSARHNTDRFFKHAVNAIVGYTSASVAEAEALTHRVKWEASFFTAEELSAIKHYWKDALLPNREVKSFTNHYKNGHYRPGRREKRTW